MVMDEILIRIRMYSTVNTVISAVMTDSLIHVPPSEGEHPEIVDQKNLGDGGTKLYRWG